MRIPVFARGANPRVERPILKKSKSYCDQQVMLGIADYIDPTDPSKGMLCRELLYFGEREFKAETVDPTKLNLAALEVGNARFRAPSSADWQEVHALPTHNLRVRAFLTLGAFRASFEANQQATA